MGRSTSSRKEASGRTKSAPRARRSPGAGKGGTKVKAGTRGSRRNRLRAVSVPLVVAAMVVVMGAYLYPQLKMDYAAQREVERLEASLEEIRERNDQLRTEVEGLRTPEGVERAARESLGYVRPGENAYVVIDSDPTTSDASVAYTTDSALVDEEAPWWRGLLDTIFGVET